MALWAVHRLGALAHWLGLSITACGSHSLLFLLFAAVQERAVELGSPPGHPPTLLRLLNGRPMRLHDYLQAAVLPAGVRGVAIRAGRQLDSATEQGMPNLACATNNTVRGQLPPPCATYVFHVLLFPCGTAVNECTTLYAGARCCAACLPAGLLACPAFYDVRPGGQH